MASSSRSKQSRSNKQWLQAHKRDAYVRKAQTEGMRSRAVYKLNEIDARDELLRKGLRVLDLGAAPGGWSQVAVEKVGPQGKVVAIDLLEMDPLDGVHVLVGDAGESSVQDKLRELLGGDGADLVLSDMAPNLTGVRMTDQAQGERLGEVVIEIVDELLSPHGSMLAKTFHGRGFEALRQAMRERFGKVMVRKPAASRSHSAEIYLVGKGFGV
jgi:23S rRNA (uridine2552-2'-O)-methyltransferase